MKTDAELLRESVTRDAGSAWAGRVGRNRPLVCIQRQVSGWTRVLHGGVGAARTQDQLSCAKSL